LVAQRTGLCSQIRGLLAEYGIVMPITVPKLRRALPEILEDAENELTVQGRRLIASLHDELRALQERIEPYDRFIEQAAIDSEACRRLRGIPGIGPISATAVVATMGDPRVFKNGRHFAAFLGLVPRQYSSGGKSHLGRISRRGDVYLRRILIQGAHTTLRWLDRRRGPRADWVRELVARRGKKVAAVALANKNARIAWRLLSEGSSYEEVRAAA
jgi:transposase